MAVVALAASLLWRAHKAPGTETPHDAAPASLTRGALTLTPCALGASGHLPGASLAAHCTELDVPEDWAHPESRHIRLRVAIVTALSSRPAPDPVVFLDGGPGGAATEDFPLVAAAFEPLRRHHDVWLIDQRGTGGSNALRCESPSKTTAGDAPQTLLKACLEQLKDRADVRLYRTSDAVRDLEAVRKSLGSPQLNLFGVSYGTRLAQQYAGANPQSVRSIILDSPVPNRLALGSEHARNLEDTLKRRFARCAEQSDCQAHFGDPYATLMDLKARLAAHPATIEAPDPVTFATHPRTFGAADLATTVRFYAYNPVSSALLPLTLDEAKHGNLKPLLAQEEILQGDLTDRLTGGMELSVICAEDADLLTEQPEDANTLLGTEFVQRAKNACALWPHGGRAADFHEPLRTTVPVLLLAGEFDPVTPERYAREIAESLPNSRVLLAKGQGHAVMGVGCMPQLTEKFVMSLAPAQLDVTCLSMLGDRAPFLTYSGPAP
jgi:pimeloyl-ACP methyl ester carboxylesterase